MNYRAGPIIIDNKFMGILKAYVIRFSKYSKQIKYVDLYLEDKRILTICEYK